jgi:hypothetical protein
VDAIPENILEVTGRGEEIHPAETKQTLVTQVQPEKHIEASKEESLETKKKAEDLVHRESLPAPTDSDGEAAVAKPAKKGKKSKKKSH